MYFISETALKNRFIKKNMKSSNYGCNKFTVCVCTFQLMEYCLVSGRLSFCEFPVGPDKSLNLTQILYTALFNVQLLLTSAHRYDNQEFLVAVLRSVTLVQVYQDMEKGLVRQHCI